MGVKTPEFDDRIDYRKNYIINGAMEIAQRGTVFTAIGNLTYHLDRFRYFKTGAMVHTASQSTDVPTQAESGYRFKNSLRLNLTTPDTAIASTDVVAIEQRIEGSIFQPIAQKVTTLSFWVKATLPGIYSVALRNTGNDRSFVQEYTINSSDVWEYKTITVAASPTAGTWDYNSGIGVKVAWPLAVGSTQQTATLGVWQTGDFLASTNSVNGVNTGATDFRITGVMLNEGPVAAPFSLSGEDFAGEVELCQRYYEKSYDLDVTPGSSALLTGLQAYSPGAGTGAIQIQIGFSVRKRNTATVTPYNALTGVTNQFRRSDTADVGCNPANISQWGFVFVNSSTTLEGFTHYVHFTADSEL